MIGVDARRLRRRGSNIGEERIIAEWVQRAPPRHRFYVDIAAGDGVTMSNTQAFARGHWDGLAVEADPHAFAQLARAYTRRHPRVRLAQTLVTPDNVVVLLQTHGVPPDFGVLSLDIDGYDYFVLVRLLEAFRPALICAEINEAIPPPVKFTVTYRADHVWAKDHFFGQSLAPTASRACRGTGKWSFSKDSHPTKSSRHSMRASPATPGASSARSDTATAAC